MSEESYGDPVKAGRVVTPLPYPHTYNDCDGCRERDADVWATYPSLQSRPLRWCQDCAGGTAAALVGYGYTLTLTAPTRETSATARILCPEHKMPDCSPLLNGCPRLTATGPSSPIEGDDRG